jgi:nucleoside-diphosphate kinase
MFNSLADPWQFEGCCLKKVHPSLQGYYLRALKMMNVPKELAEEHYVDLSSKPFYPGLVKYIARCALLVMSIPEGTGANRLHAVPEVKFPVCSAPNTALSCYTPDRNLTLVEHMG